jgi:uncharacterized protein (TIGR02147 family)
MNSIYEYLDFRQYLKDYYDYHKESDHGFSYRIWADRAGFKAKDFILRVIRGGSRLSAESISSLASAMYLSSAETLYFTEMVWYAQAKTFDDRERRYARLYSQRVRYISKSDTRVMPHDHFEFYSEWYHTAIRSLISSYGFKDDYEWLAENVFPAISFAKARKSVALLEKLGLIKKDKSGIYRVTDADLTTGDEVKKGALLKFYHTGMELMKRALEKLPMDKRNVSGITAGVSEATYLKMIEKIKKFRQEIAQLVKEDHAPDRVYQVNVHVFPMSNVFGKKRNKK